MIAQQSTQSRPMISATSAGFFSNISDQVFNASFLIPRNFVSYLLSFYCYFSAFMTVASSILLPAPLVSFYFLISNFSS